MIIGFLAVIAVPLMGLMLMSLFSRRPTNLGVTNGRLAECPASPNCVCSHASDAAHRAEPLTFSDSPAEAMARVKAVVTAMPRTRIVTETETYLHVEFTSRIFRFTDDVEFLLDSNAKVIHFRSASRVGYSDLGVNRARMEAIRREFEHKK